MENKLIGLLLALTVGVIMTGALVAPIVADYADTEKTHYNEGMYYASADDDTHTIIITASDITVDGEAVDQSLFPSGFTQYTLVYAESAFIRMDTSAVIVRTVSSGLVNYDYSDDTVTISVSGTTATVSSTDTDTSSSSITGVTFYIANEGDYTLSNKPCVLSDSQIYGAGQTYFQASTWSLPEYLNVYTVWSGDIDAVTGSVILYYPTATYPSCAISDIDVNTTELSGGLYRIDSVVVTYTATDTDSEEYTPYSTYTYFLAPASVTYENVNYLGTSNAAMLGAVVVVVLVAFVAIAANGMNRDKDL